MSDVDSGRIPRPGVPDGGTPGPRPQPAPSTPRSGTPTPPPSTENAPAGTPAEQLYQWAVADGVITEIENAVLIALETGSLDMGFGAFEDSIAAMFAAMTGGYGSYGGGGPTTGQSIDSMTATVQRMAINANLQITPEQARSIATVAVNNKWNEIQIQNAVGEYGTGNTQQIEQAAFGTFGSMVQDMAKQYGIRLSEQSWNDYTTRFARGQESETTLKAKFQQQAMTMFPALAERIKNGETFSDVVAPYQEYAARLLERDPKTIDFTEDAYMKAFTFNPDGKGQRTMSITEFGDYIRSNRQFGYEYTDNAKTKAFQIANALGETFGRI